MTNTFACQDPERQREIATAAPSGVPEDAILIDWPRETKDPVAEMDRIYTEYATTFGGYPDAAMSRTVRKVKEMLFDWWAWHREAIHAALLAAPAKAGGVPADMVPARATDAELEGMFIGAGGWWDGDRWVIEDANLHPALRTVLASVHPTVNDAGQVPQVTPLGESAKGEGAAWEEVERIVAFLHYEAPLDGAWYGQTAVGKPCYWWRSRLRSALAQIRKAAPPASSTDTLPTNKP